MVRVPSYDNFRAAPEVARRSRADFRPLNLRTPDLRVSTPQFDRPDAIKAPRIGATQINPNVQPGITPEVAAMRGQSIAQFGQSLAGMGRQLAPIAMAMQEQANGLVVDDALNAARSEVFRLATDEKEGYVHQRGKAALAIGREDGRPLSAAYLEKFDTSVEKIAEGLKNDAQRRAFTSEVGRLRASFEGQVRSHEAQEYHGYNVSVNEATITSSMQRIVSGYTDPSVLDAELPRVAGAVANLARLSGKSDDEVRLAVGAKISQAHAAVISQAIAEDKLAFANAYLEKHNDALDPIHDLPRLRAVLTEQTDASVALRVANAALNGAIAETAVANSDGALIVDITGDAAVIESITRNAESGNRDYGAGGQPITSRTGAKYALQVQPDTARDPGHGIRPAANDSPEEYNRVGRELQAALLRKYGGDPKKMWAAYVAGERWVDKAIAKGGEAGWFDAFNNDERSARNRRDAQNYVEGNVAALAKRTGGRGHVGGVSTRPPIDAVVNSILADPNLTDRQKNLAISQATRLHGIYEQAEQDRESEAFSAAMEHIHGGGTIADMPAALRSRIPGERWPTLEAYEKQKVSGADVTTDQEFWGELWFNPEKLLTTNLTENRHRLSDSDYQELVRRKTSLRDALLAGNDDVAANVRSNEQIINGFLIEAGMDPNTKDKDERRKVNQIWHDFDKEVQRATRENGKPLTSEQRANIASLLFTRVVVDGKSMPVSTAALIAEDKPERVAIPPGRRAQITQILTSRYGRAPTPREITHAYLYGVAHGDIPGAQPKK